MLNNQYVLMDTKPEIDVVLFCGGGGADTGIEQARGGEQQRIKEQD